MDAARKTIIAHVRRPRDVAFLVVIICTLFGIGWGVLRLGISLPFGDVQKKPYNIRVRLKWHHQTEFAGFYVAQEKGYYAKEGLNVVLEEGKPEEPPISMVVSGRDEFGVTGAEAILVARSKNLPVVAIAAVFQHSPFCYILRKSKNVSNPSPDFQDLVQIKARVGINQDISDTLLFRAMLKADRVPENSISTSSIGSDRDAIKALLDGRVYAIPAYSINEPIVLKHEHNLECISVTFGACKMPTPYGDTIFTTDNLISDHEDVVRGFLKATLQGWQDALSDHADAVAQTLGHIKETRPLTKYDKPEEADKMKLIPALVDPDPNDKYALSVGRMDLDRWEDLQRTLSKDFGDKMKVDLTEVQKPDFLPAVLP